mgnify:CR=1 FL=1
MKRKLLSLVTILSFSINPFVKRKALNSIDKDSGYILSQITNFSTVFLYFLTNTKQVNLYTIPMKNIFYSYVSSLITIAGSTCLSASLKDNDNIAVHMATINSLNILCSFMIESYIKYEWLEIKKVFGVFCVCYGINLLN